MGQEIPGTVIRPGGWMRRGSALWVWPPGEPAAIRLCGLTRTVRMDPCGPTVVGTIAGRWVLYNGNWGAVSS